jgi:hypothetical protein
MEGNSNGPVEPLGAWLNLAAAGTLIQSSSVPTVPGLEDMRCRRGPAKRACTRHGPCGMCSWAAGPLHRRALARLMREPAARRSPL